MPFTKGMKPTKGFTGKKHSGYSKIMISDAQKSRHAKRKIANKENK